MKSADDRQPSPPEKRKKRVAFIINSLAGGGAEKVMCTLLRSSRFEGQEVDISLILLDDEPAAYEPPDWLRVMQLNSRQSFIRSLVLLIGALRTIRPDVTLSFLTRANVASLIACHLLGIPSIISERVNTSSHFSGGAGATVSRWLVRSTYHWARRIIAVSPGVAGDLSTSFGVPPDKLVVIANPIDVEAIQQLAGADSEIPDGPITVAMGRFVPNKNFSLLIDGFAQSGISGTLVVLGDGPERKALEERARDRGLAGRVVMPGFSKNPFPIISRAQIFVLPSNAEGFPNSLLEAMSLGIPVISTNCASGPSDVLADQPPEKIAGDRMVLAEHGILVPTNNVEAMAEALHVFQDASLRREYGAKAAARAKHFSVDRSRDLYWRVIRSQFNAK
jgi:glycosyltransferase involved in cell wall biosynthesis